jgi:S-adenosylmethionine:tRNA ribosyltransferase-isomerase
MSNFPFDFDLPPDLIAQEPCAPRDHARLLVARRADRSLRHHHFFDLPDLLAPGDLLVLNDTRVLPARLLGKRARTGGKWEGLFLRQMPTNPERKRGDDAAPFANEGSPPGDHGIPSLALRVSEELPGATWEMICQTRGTLDEGEIIEIEPGPLTLRLKKRLPAGRWQVEPLLPGSPTELLARFGHIPLPPYIRKGAARAEDRERYQTIYAQQAGAIAAPTAGLHFTERVFTGLQKRGIAWTTVTLHVGLGTFQPIQADDFTQHPMHAEWGRLSQAAVDTINACKSRGGRVVAVGTTSVRVLETVARSGSLQAWAGETELFIHPPYEFKVVDALVTNFHLPKTTLLLLVAAFAGGDLFRQAYETAMSERYRFYSYGDAMLIV